MWETRRKANLGTSYSASLPAVMVNTERYLHDGLDVEPLHVLLQLRIRKIEQLQNPAIQAPPSVSSVPLNGDSPRSIGINVERELVFSLQLDQCLKLLLEGFGSHD